MWLVVTLLANAILAVVGVTDKLILTKAVHKPVVFVFYSTVFTAPLFFLLPFGVSFPLVWLDHLIFAVSGICFSFGLWALYTAYQESEVSHAAPLVGAATPFFVVILSAAFLAERLTTGNLAAVFVLILGSLFISFENSRLHNGWHRGMAWGVLAGLLFAVSHVAAKYAYDAYGFYNGFVWTKIWIAVFGAVLLVFPSVRAVFAKKSPGGRLDHRRFLIFTNKFLGLAGVVLIQYAIALGSVSLVNALAGAQYALLIILVAVISKFWPRIIKETYTKQEIAQEVVAVALIGLGLILLI